MLVTQFFFVFRFDLIKINWFETWLSERNLSEAILKYFWIAEEVLQFSYNYFSSNKE